MGRGGVRVMVVMVMMMMGCACAFGVYEPSVEAVSITKDLFCLIDYHTPHGSFEMLQTRYDEIHQHAAYMRKEKKGEGKMEYVPRTHGCKEPPRYHWDIDLMVGLADTSFLIEQHDDVDSYVRDKITRHCTDLHRACVVFVRTDLFLSNKETKERHDQFDTGRRDRGWARAFMTTFQQLQMKFVFISYTYEDLCAPYRSYPMFYDEVDPDGVFWVDELLNSELLIGWFTKNPCLVHPKLTAIPIGFKWHPGSTTFHAQLDGRLKEFVTPYQSEAATKTLFYSRNRTQLLSPPVFEIANTGSSLYKPHRGTRPRVFDLLTERFGKEYTATVKVRKSGYPLVEHVDFKEYVEGILSSKFVVSPAGNGIDCHRTWEAFSLGAIPIAQSSPLNALYHDLPIVQLRDWTVINEKLLEELYVKLLAHHRYAWEKLSAVYWVEKIIETTLRAH
jgi:hypothetical protein